MIFHLCSHFGDIEIEEAGDDKARIKFSHLTPMERESLTAYLKSLNLGSLAFQRTDRGEGDITIPRTVAEAGAALSGFMHGNNALLSAASLSDGDINVTRHSFLDWFRGLLQRNKSDKIKPPEVEAVVQTPVPARGCPMPTPTDMREAKAAAVVRKFLRGQQRGDFDRKRAFLAQGCDTGHMYRVTSRWAPEVSRWGVLYDLESGSRICASNTDLPPSEEVLSMLFSIEHYEQRFLDSGHGVQFK